MTWAEPQWATATLDRYQSYLEQGQQARGDALMREACLADLWLLLRTPLHMIRRKGTA